MHAKPLSPRCRRRCRCPRLPLRVATYSLQGPETEKVQILIHADVGTDYSSSRVASLGYMISDSAGHLVDSHLGERAAAAGDEWRAVGVAIRRRRQPAARRVLDEARGRGGRSRGHGRAHDSRRVCFRLPALRVSDLMVGGPVSTGEELLAADGRLQRRLRRRSRIHRGVRERRRRR